MSKYTAEEIQEIDRIAEKALIALTTKHGQPIMELEDGTIKFTSDVAYTIAENMLCSRKELLENNDV